MIFVIGLQLQVLISAIPLRRDCPKAPDQGVFDFLEILMKT